METKKITIKNPTRTRKWGWGWTNTPTGRDAYSIERPGIDYTGTWKQIYQRITADKTYASMLSGGTFVNTAWFYDGKYIVNQREFKDWLNMSYANEPVTIEIEVEQVSERLLN